MNTPDCKYYEDFIKAAVTVIEVCGLPLKNYRADLNHGDRYIGALADLVQGVKIKGFTQFYAPWDELPVSPSAEQRQRGTALAVMLQQRYDDWCTLHAVELNTVTEGEVIAAVQAATMTSQQSHASGARH